MYKIVAFDIDETLLDDHKKIPHNNIEAIRQLIAMGIHCVPCSGRGYRCLDDITKLLDINHKGMYSILGNGAIVVDNENDEILHCDALPSHIMEDLLQYCQKHKINIQFMTIDAIYAYELDPVEKSYMDDIGADYIEDCFDTSFFTTKTIYKVLLQRKDMPYLQSIHDDIETICQGHTTLSYSSDRYLEVNLLGTSKASGLAFVANLVGTTLNECIGVGDNLNDLELIKQSGMGIAVQNAVDAIKQHANHICNKTNNEGAIEEVANTFFLSKQRQGE